eukprot:1999543-Karenia_brevis.AAC.1
MSPANPGSFMCSAVGPGPRLDNCQGPWVSDKPCDSYHGLRKVINESRKPWILQGFSRLLGVEARTVGF